ncbi:hypothetical protein VCV18_009017 [Metarhizium anisopliae]
MNKTNPNQGRSSNTIQDVPSVKDDESNSGFGSDDMDDTEYETEDKTEDDSVCNDIDPLRGCDKGMQIFNRNI